MSPKRNSLYTNKIIRLTDFSNIRVILRRQSHNTYLYDTHNNNMIKREFAPVAYSLQL